jgi:hypothetical protein
MLKLKLEDIDSFFTCLSKKWPHPTRIIISGGAASLVMGGRRPTLDIDFEVDFSKAKNVSKEEFQEAIKKTMEATAIKAQFSEDIQRWSEISFIDYRGHLKAYKDFKSISVYILDAKYWSIGKISRYWDQDIQDMLAVFKKERVDPIDLLTIWKAALSDSCLSSKLNPTKKHILHFFTTFGRKIWIGKYPGEKISAELKTIS